MSGFEWLCVVSSLALMGASFWVRMVEDRAALATRAIRRR